MFPATNNKRATIAGLNATGWIEDKEAETRKYRVFRHREFGRVWLIGHLGALRWLPSGAKIAEGYSMTGTNYHKALIVVGRRAPCYSSEQQARADLQVLSSDVEKLWEAYE